MNLNNKLTADSETSKPGNDWDEQLPDQMIRIEGWKKKKLIRNKRLWNGTVGWLTSADSGYVCD